MSKGITSSPAGSRWNAAAVGGTTVLPTVAVAEEHLVHEGLLVHGHRQRRADVHVLQDRVAVGVGDRGVGARVDADRREAGRDRRVRRRCPAGSAASCTRLACKVSAKSISPVAQRGHHGVLVLVDAEHDLVDVRRTRPVVGVGLERPRLTLVPVHQVERTGRDRRVGLRVVVLEGLGLLLVDVLPDVLGQDVVVDREQPHRGLLGLDHQRRSSSGAVTSVTNFR